MDRYRFNDDPGTDPDSYFHLYADPHPDPDPYPDPDWHQNGADHHADPIPRFTYVGNQKSPVYHVFSFSSVSIMS